MNANKQRALVSASVAGLLAAVAAMAGNPSVQAQEAQEAMEKVPCYGLNKCQGLGECGGKGHGCAGMNACQGQGYIKLEQDTCLKIQNGRLTQEPEETPS